MRFGFITCVQLGLSCMEAICETGASLAIALTLRDELARKKSGRVYLDDFCKDHHIPLSKISHINDNSTIDHVRNAQLDWLFIIGWSQIANHALLSSVKRGVLGIHPTLLPMGRGRAAIPWAILKGLKETGVTLFKLDQGVDTGPVLKQCRIPLGSTTDATLLYDKVTRAHTRVIREVMPELLAGKEKLVAQNESKASYWPERKPADGEILLNGSVKDAERLVRAVTRPYPGAFVYQDGKKWIIWKSRIVSRETSSPCIRFPDGILELIEYELPGN